MDPISGYDVILGVGSVVKGREWWVWDECGGESVREVEDEVEYFNVLILHQA